ncbi:hypothetical protein C1T31_01530 [Hanstruepera neustonica]|uniref:Uncharacterized protein n=1 Tax=Hanstruepera neustonica TaxID=1445657 RepID=A0A2K1E3J6_9FLAO|nr:hypothetical protein [Hanstruepera neustonica]PNQ74847.1 hypothetical protein C1T31_01530 [Hanstruepera neustonica]
MFKLIYPIKLTPYLQNNKEIKSIVKRFIFVYMKTHLIVVFCTLFFACKSGQQTNVSEKLESLCPNDGTCSFEVLKNKSIDLKFDGLGQLYPDIIDSNKMVVKFEYKRNEIPNTADSGYREIIYLELEPNKPELDINDSELEITKALFARLCFCRGQTGYYRINKGSLSVKGIKEGLYRLEFSFNIGEVPQIINSVSGNFNI